MKKAPKGNNRVHALKEAVESLKAVQPIKDGMLKEVRCKGCGKTFLTNFEMEYCYNCPKT